MLAENPLTVDGWHIKDIVVEKTILDGQVVYDVEA